MTVEKSDHGLSNGGTSGVAGRTLRLLVIDDSVDDFHLLGLALKRASIVPQARRVDSEQGLRAALAEERWDAVIVDHVIPGYGGPQALGLLRAEYPDLAVVVVSGKVDEETIVDDLRLGADDYVFKSGLSRLVPALEQALRAAEGRRERRRADEALRESEERYRRVVEGTSEGLLELDADYRIVTVNDRWLEMMGHQRPDVVGRRVHEFLFAEDLPDLEANIERRRRGIPGRHERRFRRSDGSELWALISAVPRIAADGSFAGVVALWLDITAGKRAERGLAESEAKLRAFIEQSIEGIMLADAQGLCVEFNARMERLTGLTAKDVVGHPVWELMDRMAAPVDGHNSTPGSDNVDAIHGAIATGSAPFLSRVEEARIVDAQGNERWIAHSCFPVQTPGETMIGCVLTDITERRRAEEALRESEGRYRLLAEHGSDVIWVLDPEKMRFTYVSPSVEWLRGFTPEEVMARDVTAALTPDSVQKIGVLARERLEAYQAGERRAHVDLLEQPCKDGGTVWTEVATSYMTDEETGRHEIHGVSRDITERLRAEDHARALAQMVDASPAAITVHDPDGRFLYSNEQTLALHGYSREEYQELTLADLDVPESAALYAARMREVAEIGRASFEVAHRHKDGSLIPLWVDAQMVEWRGEPAVLSVASDLSEIKRAETTLRESEAALRAILEAAKESVFMIDAQGIILAANETTAARLGDATEALVGRNVYDLLPPDLARKRREMVEEVVAGGEPAVWEDIRGGFALENSVYPIFDADGRVERLAVFSRDVTERRRVEDLRIEHAARLRRTVEGAVLAMGSAVEMRDPYTAGHERRVTRMAEAIGRDLGLDDERLEGLRLAGSVHDIGKIAVPAEILSKPGRLHDYEYNLVQGHPQVGADILRAIDFQQPVADIVLQHHERIDGSGYPQGLSGDQILPEARILAVADVVEAMASHRPYRPSLGIEAALAEIRDGAGSRYDAAAAAACERIVAGGFSFDFES